MRRALLLWERERGEVAVVGGWRWNWGECGAQCRQLLSSLWLRDSARVASPPPPPLRPPLPPSSCIPTFSLPASSPSVSRSLCVSEDHHPRSLSHSFSISPLSVPHTPPLSGRWAQSARPAALSKERRKIHTIITLTGATCGWWCAVFRQVPAISHPHCFCWFWAASAVGASASAALRLSSHPSSCLLTPLLQLNLHQPSTHLAQTPVKADPASTGGCAWWSPQLTSRKTPGTTPVPATRASQDATVRYGHLHYLSEFEGIEIWSVWRRMWLRVNSSRSSNETSGPDYIRSYNRNKALIDWTVEWVIDAGEVLGLCVCVTVCRQDLFWFGIFFCFKACLFHNSLSSWGQNIIADALVLTHWLRKITS